ncbi:MAG: hypothetical protein J07HX64_02934 [halophilic archaeon J07HX64]|jgi:hypothetical protein|nr:MAG: hypothetical protein J07HX64_02934 [halophilic archaeon J07HX64]
MSANETHTQENARTPSPADNSTTVTLLLSVFVSPLGYYYIGKKKLALINLVTLNYIGLGFIAVPIHTYMIMQDAEQTHESGGGGRSDGKRSPSQINKYSATSNYLRQYRSTWIRSD